MFTEKGKWQKQVNDSNCAIILCKNTVLALPSCNVGLQYYSLQFTQTAFKTIMVHRIGPCNFVNCFIHHIFIHKMQINSGPCVANSTFEQFFAQRAHFPPPFGHALHIKSCYFVMLMHTIWSLVYILFSNSKGIFPPHTPAVKGSEVVATQVYHLYGFGEMFSVVKVHIYTVQEDWLFAQSTADLGAVRRVWQKVDMDAGEPAAVQVEGLISALYNLIHGFISSDESMTDIQ